MKSWVLVADSSRGRIFSAETPTSALKEIESISHPEGRLHDQLMVSDLPGKMRVQLVLVVMHIRMRLNPGSRK